MSSRAVRRMMEARGEVMQLPNNVEEQEEVEDDLRQQSPSKNLFAMVKPQKERG